LAELETRAGQILQLIVLAQRGSSDPPDKIHFYFFSV
jgi:hypothetical protein